MSKEIIKDETGVYMKIPRDKIKFVSKEAEIMFDIVMENDYLQQENNALKEKFRATNKGLQKVRLKRKKWKHRYVLERCEIKKLKTQLEVGEQQYNDLVEEKESLQEQLSSNTLQLEELKRQNEFLMERDNKCQILEQQYCERTDCSGRLGASKKVEALEKENEELKKQLEYLRSGEYLNQLKFERDMLQHIVENSEVSKEDKEFIDMTHRNIELLKENEGLKKQLEKYKKKLMIATKMEIKEIDKNTFVGIDYFQNKCVSYKAQQKEFIKYLGNEIERLPGLTTWFYRNAKGKLIGHTEIVQGTYKEILQKYKEIVNGTEQD